jgi:hypothetical protein
MYAIHQRLYHIQPSCGIPRGNEIGEPSPILRRFANRLGKHFLIISIPTEHQIIHYQFGLTKKEIEPAIQVFYGFVHLISSIISARSSLSFKFCYVTSIPNMLDRLSHVLTLRR